MVTNIKISFILVCLCTTAFQLNAQTGVVPIFKDAIAANRTKTYNNIVKKSIVKNLSLPLTDSTEEYWQSAFTAAALLQYKQPWVLEKVKQAFATATNESFTQALLEFVYTNYKNNFVPQVAALTKGITNPKLLSMCAEYLFANNKIDKYKTLLQNRIAEISKGANEQYYESFFAILNDKLNKKKHITPSLTDFFLKNYLPGQTLLFSIQRKNRNFPGIVLVRDSAGNFITDTAGKLFYVQQLARSMSNMPGYITNGNTPQGVFKIVGIDVSKNNFIGPTPNIQLIMPFEKSALLADSVGLEFGRSYMQLLPKSWQEYFPIKEAFFAGLAGRTEIIAHGTTINPDYYKGQSYYPHTPTLGCLCTKEIWSTVDGKRTESNQQKLVDAYKKAGSTTGYLIVVEIDDKQKAVSIQEVLSYIKSK